MDMGWSVVVGICLVSSSCSRKLKNKLARVVQVFDIFILVCSNTQVGVQINVLCSSYKTSQL